MDKRYITTLYNNILQFIKYRGLKSLKILTDKEVIDRMNMDTFLLIEMALILSISKY